MKLLLVGFLVLPITLLAEGGLPNQRYIYVEGKGEIEKVADMVTLRFDLVARNADQAKANQEVQAKAAKIFGSLNDRKIAPNNVVAEDLKSQVQYEDDEDSSPKRGKLIGYSVTRSFEIKVRDVTVFAKLVDELLALGGAEFSAIDGGLCKEKEIQDDAWVKALTNAREKAQKTLMAAGMKIDSIFAASPVAFPEIRRKMLGFNEGYGSAATERVVVPDPMQYRLAPVSVIQSVHIIYLISSGN